MQNTASPFTTQPHSPKPLRGFGNASRCKLHYAAFDRYFLGIRSDYTVEIREDILDETDGPMLQHGLKELHGKRIVIPRSSELRPDPDLLERRYQRFREAS